jgi:uncharacterized membrane protein YeaQ/YmgE (transglycosylase-associated protein family)
MSLALLIFWGAVGWCGTGWRRWPPPPPPDPWWFIERIIAIVGGLAGGVLFNSAWTVVQDQPLNVVASAVGALVGAYILMDLAAFLRPRATKAS